VTVRKTCLSLVVLIPQIDCASRLVGNVPTSRVRNPSSAPKFLRKFAHWLLGQLPDLNVKDLLPLSFEGLNGGIVCGNMSTSNILVAEFSRADGSFGTVMVRRFSVILFLTRQLTRWVVSVQVKFGPVQATAKYQVSECHDQSEGE
jgi:hypothetical protein